MNNDRIVVQNKTSNVGSTVEDNGSVGTLSEVIKPTESPIDLSPELKDIGVKTSNDAVLLTNTQRDIGVINSAESTQVKTSNTIFADLPKTGSQIRQQMKKLKPTDPKFGLLEVYLRNFKRGKLI